MKFAGIVLTAMTAFALGYSAGFFVGIDVGKADCLSRMWLGQRKMRKDDVLLCNELLKA